MEWRVWLEIELSVSVDSFWRAVTVWTDKPHVLNKRLCAVSLQKCFIARNVHQEIDTWDAVKRFTPSNNFSHVPPYWEIGSQQPDDEVFDLKVQLRTLLPKQPDKYGAREELTLFDARNSTAVYVPSPKTDQLKECSIDFPYAFHYDERNSKLRVMVAGEGRSGEWLRSSVVPKIVKWSLEREDQRGTSSLALVPTERYFQRYHELKIKYGKPFVQMWTEKTDPAKFVHEDVAIAAYLLVLWEEERKTSETRLQSFADLGCGNGLLVHILSSEGHPGVGLDVRRRKIWDRYGSGTVLKETVITPSESCLLPDCDWFVGNHSDELTPWIPVMAARSSRRSRFFVLPCCSYDFNGKFQRAVSGTSRYRSYLDYVRSVGEVCGFDLSEDRLRIPSTKRICLVGRRKTGAIPEWSEVDGRITRFIADRVGQVPDAGQGRWTTGFEARPSTEPIRNCTRLDPNLKESIIRKVTDALLGADSHSVLVCTDDGDRSWRTGGSLSFDRIVVVIEPEELWLLKNEFGGLKTLLKNHYQIFEVSRDGVRLHNYSVSFPQPRRRSKNAEPGATKKKLCWFHDHHPDGCPVKRDRCPFAHGQTDL